jgi:TetR/AcrR family transcriptional repressor of nem operon
MNDKTTRDHIIEAADKLFYQQGYEHTSFSDISNVVQVSRGNFYYHFKSKDAILDAVITFRLAKTQTMLDQWEAGGARPEDRIRSFIHILIANRAKIMLYGCPVGTLCAELAKLDHALQNEANKLFTLFRNWLSKQFVLLGCEVNADALAMHLLARSQGIATLASALRDEDFIRREVEALCGWLGSCAQNASCSGTRE